MKLPENVSESVRRRNPELYGRENNAGSAASNPKSKQVVCDESLAEKKGARPNAGRIVLRFVSWRLRLCDPDDLCPKYFIDGLRYAGLIPGDSETEVDYERPRQVKVYHKRDERTEITIEAL